MTVERAHPASDTELTADDFDSDRWLSRAARVAEQIELGMLAGYRLTRVVARGSQGTVYEATEPRTNRRVAIKRLPTAEPSERESALFALETAALASLSVLSHPNIVTLLAAPEVDHARLLIMEWIDGAPFDTWADSMWATLPPRDAVRAIIASLSRTASAIAAAHAMGLIHRDLKPSNVLVSKGNAPTVLDFGIAKSLVVDAQLTRTDAFTGTPAWAAPEQIVGSSTLVDARVDVHGLGLLLYRALTGRCAVDSSLPIAPLFNAIATQVPAPPSKLRAAIPRELDAVVAKALEKDPARRYQSADALHRELERFLRGEPVEAHPPSIPYLLRTAAKRHRAFTAAAVTALLVIVGAAIISGKFAIDAHSARAEADARAEQAEAATARAVRMNDFFRGLLARVREREAAGERASARDIVAMAAASLESEPHPPESEVALRETLGIAFFEIGDYASSAAEYARAIDASAHATPDDGLEQARLLVLRSRSLLRVPAHAKAAESARAAVELYATHGASDRVRSHASEALAMACLLLGTLDEARSAIDDSLMHAHRAQDPHHLAISYCTESLLLLEEGQVAQAASRAKEAVDMLREVPSATVAERARVLHNAGAMCGALGEHGQAIAFLRASLQLREREYAAGHPSLNLARSALSANLRSIGHFDEAVSLMEEALAEFSASHPEPSFDRANLRRQLAFAYIDRATPQDMERAIATALAAITEFAEIGDVTARQCASAAHAARRATQALHGAEAARALIWTIPESLGHLIRTPVEVAWIRAALIRDMLNAPADRRIAVDDQMVAVLREGLEHTNHDGALSSSEAIEISLALSQALLATTDPALRDEGRALARRSLGPVREHYGGNAPAMRRAQSLADAE